MPIHDWSRVHSGIFHDFHLGWVVEIKRYLNRGPLPVGHYALLESPQRWDQANRIESDSEAFARRANRIAVRNKLNSVVAIIEIVSPGNKESIRAIQSFAGKAVDCLRSGINLVVIDLFPTSPCDPEGIHRAIWTEFVDEQSILHSTDKPFTIISYEAASPPCAYIETFSVGDTFPDTAMFLAPGWYVNIPLEQTYAASWAFTPKPIRELVEPQ